MIKVENIVHHYGLEPILRGIDLEVETGEILALMGPNGMGKSTLLGVMAGALSPVIGAVYVDGIRRRSSVEAERAVRHKVGYLADPSWLPAERTIREFLYATAQLYDVPYERVMIHAESLLELFELRSKGTALIRALSSGQRRKVALSAVLITESPVLILDEPFSGGLDPGGIVALKSVLRRLSAEKGVTIVLSTPVPEIIEGLANRVALIHEGELAASVTPDKLATEVGGEAGFAAALGRLVRPDAEESVHRYFETIA